MVASCSVMLTWQNIGEVQLSAVAMNMMLLNMRKRVTQCHQRRLLLSAAAPVSRAMARAMHFSCQLQTQILLASKTAGKYGAKALLDNPDTTRTTREGGLVQESNLSAILSKEMSACSTTGPSPNDHSIVCISWERAWGIGAALWDRVQARTLIQVCSCSYGGQASGNCSNSGLVVLDLLLQATQGLLELLAGHLSTIQ